MPRHGYCRICEYWKDYPYKVSEKELFNKKCREGVSLRKLELLLEAYGIRAKKDLIRTHIKNCMNLEVREQRGIEKELAKEKGLRGLGRKISGFFIQPKLELPQKCVHTATTSFQSLHDGNIYTKCRQCGQILGAFDPHRKKTKKSNDWLILESLRK